MTGEVSDNDSTDTEHTVSTASGGLSQTAIALNIGRAGEPEELSSDSEDSDDIGE